MVVWTGLTVYGNFHENLRQIFFTLFVSHFWLIKAKNFEKFRKMSSIFEFSISKLGFMAIFMKICGKKIWTHFVGHFWLSKAKMKVKMKKYREMSSNFESSWSRLVYAVVFKKISEKKIWPILKTLLTNQGKNENADEKIWKNKFNFWILNIKIRLCSRFHENLRQRSWKG